METGICGQETINNVMMETIIIQTNARTFARRPSAGIKLFKQSEKSSAMMAIQMILTNVQIVAWKLHVGMR